MTSEFSGYNFPRASQGSDSSRGASVAVEPCCFPTLGHFAHIYFDDASLLEPLGAYLAEGFAKRQHVVVITTPARREAIEFRLSELGIDVREQPYVDSYTVLDAEESLARFTIGGLPDPELFDITIGSLIRAVSLRSPGVRGYGDMVGLLAQRGHHVAALRLEQFWNVLGKQARFSLFCAYPSQCFEGPAGAELLENVRNAHSHLLPPSS